MHRAPQPRLEEVADRIYAYVQPDGGWCLNNAGFLVGPTAVTLIDTAATEMRARTLRSAIASVTSRAPRTLINTHHHGDHTYGNCVFAHEAVIIGHDDCPEQMNDQDMLLTHLWPHVEWGDIDIVPPSVTFPDRLTIYVGDLRVELIYVGPAHTTNDIVAWIPEHRLLFTGDVVFNGGTPFVLMGSVAGSLAALERLRGLDAETIVPGHGPIGGPELFNTTAAYLGWIQKVAQHGIASGLSPLQLAREVELGYFGEWLDQERIVGNLHRAYAEEQGAEPGIPMDHVAIMLEMVKYNDGQLPTCLA
jgi:cyclase